MQTAAAVVRLVLEVVRQSVRVRTVRYGVGVLYFEELRIAGAGGNAVTVLPVG